MNETQKTISKWLDKTVGMQSIDNQIMKLRREVEEFFTACENHDLDNMREELVDINIVSQTIATLLGMRMVQARNEKMKVNRARTWQTMEDGEIRHV